MTQLVCSFGIKIWESHCLWTKSRLGLIHDVFEIGAADQDIDVSTHGQSITFEFIMEKNPDVLFVIDRSEISV